MSPIFRKILNLVIGLSIASDILLGLSSFFNYGSTTRSNSPEEIYLFYLLFAAPILLIIWAWAIDNKEKYPKSELVIASILAIVFIIPLVLSAFLN